MTTQSYSQLHEWTQNYTSPINGVVLHMKYLLFMTAAINFSWSCLSTPYESRYQKAAYSQCGS